MKDNEKRDAFLLIIRNLFNDKSEEINSNNYLKFYHYLLDSFEDELSGLETEHPNKGAICFQIISLLENFDILCEGSNKESFCSKNGVYQFIKDHTGLEGSEFAKIMHDFRTLYIMIKDEFLLN